MAVLMYLFFSELVVLVVSVGELFPLSDVGMSLSMGPREMFSMTMFLERRGGGGG